MDNRNYLPSAERTFEVIRAVETLRCRNVAENSGLTVAEVTLIKKHLFFGKHKRFAPEVGSVIRKRFDATEEIADA